MTEKQIIPYLDFRKEAEKNCALEYFVNDVSCENETIFLKNMDNVAHRLSNNNVNPIIFCNEFVKQDWVVEYDGGDYKPDFEIDFKEQAMGKFEEIYGIEDKGICDLFDVDSMNKCLIQC